jgi:predicted TIM-barrel fold metal-dependent hydrolase
MTGIRGVILHHWPAGGAAPAPEDDRFWAVVVETGFPVTVHVGLGGGAKTEQTGSDTKKTTNWNSQVTPARSLGANTYSQYCMVQFILSGVLDRFPPLEILFAETGIGWIPSWLDSADRSYLRHQPWTGIDLPDGRLPSDYIRKHFLWSFQDDFYGVEHRHEIGATRMMWAADFPHSATDWPHSRKLIDELFDGVDDLEARAIVGGNLAAFLHL